MNKFGIICMLVFSMLFGNNANLAQAQTPNSNNVASPGEALRYDYRYYSPSGLYFLLWQWDGNLVVYKMLGSGQPTNANTVIWATNTDRSGANLALFQTDGNLVIYKGTTPVWASNTGGGNVTYGPAGMRIHDNGAISVQGSTGLTFRSAADPNAPVPFPGTCTEPKKYPICVFPGAGTPWNSFVVACSADDAYRQAAAMGATYGGCR
jgi:hypothetical protein